MPEAVAAFSGVVLEGLTDDNVCSKGLGHLRQLVPKVANDKRQAHSNTND